MYSFNYLLIAQGQELRGVVEIGGDNASLALNELLLTHEGPEFPTRRRVGVYVRGLSAFHNVSGEHGPRARGPPTDDQDPMVLRRRCKA